MENKEIIESSTEAKKGRGRPKILRDNEQFRTEYNKQYYANKKLEKNTCECGFEYNIYEKNMHLSTRKHKDYIKNQSLTEGKISDDILNNQDKINELRKYYKNMIFFLDNCKIK